MIVFSFLEMNYPFEILDNPFDVLDYPSCSSFVLGLFFFFVLSLFVFQFSDPFLGEGLGVFIWIMSQF